MIKNKIKEYVIKNYVYFELPDGQMIVQSTDGIIKTKEERLKKTL